MNLPNYFLADLPPEADLAPAMLTEACQTLKRNRERYLAHRTTPALVALLSQVARSWLEEQNPFRKMALEQGPAASGFSRKTLERGLNGFFEGLYPEAFDALLKQQFGDPDRPDEFCPSVLGQVKSGYSLVSGPNLLAHIASGNIPNPTLMSMVLGLLLRSAQFVKCASGSAFLPRLFAHSLYEADPKLGACIEIAEWRGGSTAQEQAIFDEADCITATGTDETLEAIRLRLRPGTRFVAHGHKVSFAYIGAELLSGADFRSALERAADDIVWWNQLGCLSPHVFYVQGGGTASPELFAEALAKVLETREEAEPRGELPTQVAATIASRRSIYEVRAAHHPDTRLWCSKGSTAWTVVYEADPRFQLSCLNRFAYVKPVTTLLEALQNADMVREKVSTVGLAVAREKLEEAATELARWGVTRVCPLGRMQKPPLTWRHDGRLPLNELVTWTDWEPEAKEQHPRPI